MFPGGMGNMQAMMKKVQKMLFPGHAIIRLWKNYSVVRKSLR